MDTNTTVELEPRQTSRRGWIVAAVVGFSLALVVAKQSLGNRDLQRAVAEAEKLREDCAVERTELRAQLDSLGERLAALPPPAPPGPPEVPAPGERPAMDTEKTAKEEPKTAETATADPPSQEDVMSLVRDGQPDLQSCYELALRRDPNQGSRPLHMKLSFKVRSAGRLSRVAFEPSPGRRLSACLRGVVRDWKVEPFSGSSIAVEVPITLSPQS